MKMKYDVVKIKDTNELGVVMIPEKERNLCYSLNYVTVFDDKGKDKHLLLFDDRFERVGEITVDDN